MLVGVQQISTTIELAVVLYHQNRIYDYVGLQVLPNPICNIKLWTASLNPLLAEIQVITELIFLDFFTAIVASFSHLSKYQRQSNKNLMFLCNLNNFEITFNLLVPPQSSF